MDILTDLFDRVGLRTNTEKTKVMTCVNEKIRLRQSEEVYRNQREGFHTERDWRNRRMDCDVCGMELSAQSLQSHLETQHGVFGSRAPPVEADPTPHQQTELTAQAPARGSS